MPGDDKNIGLIAIDIRFDCQIAEDTHLRLLAAGFARVMERTGAP